MTSSRRFLMLSSRKISAEVIPQNEVWFYPLVNIQITFSEEINSATVSSIGDGSGTIELRNITDSLWVEGTLSTSDNIVYVFEPDVPLIAGNDYSVILSSSIAGIGGRHYDGSNKPFFAVSSDFLNVTMDGDSGSFVGYTWAFDTRLSGDGEANINGSGELILSGAVATDAALINRTDLFSTVDHTFYRIRVKKTDVGGFTYLLSVIDNLSNDISDLNPNDTSTYLTSNNRLLITVDSTGAIGYRESATYSWKHWDTVSEGYMPATWTNRIVPLNAYETVELESDGTQWRINIYASDDSTLTLQTDWVDWADTGVGSHKYVAIGDPFTDYAYPALTVDYYKEFLRYQ